MSKPPDHPPGQGYGQDDWDSPAYDRVQSQWQGLPSPHPQPNAQQPYPQPGSPQQAYPQHYPQAYPRRDGKSPNAKPNTDAWGKAFAAAGVAMLILFGALFAAYGPPASSGIGKVIGRLVFIGGAAGTIVALTAKGSRKLWPWWRYYLLMVPAVLVVMFLSARGSA